MPEQPSSLPGPSETPRDAEQASSHTLLTSPDNVTPNETPPPVPFVSALTPPVSPADMRTDAPARIGRYPVFGEIGHGGMGAVLRGRDPDLGRELAIKVLLEDHQARPEMARRFIAEARVGGRLQHPGVVPVYELGHAPAAGAAMPRPYFTMKLIEGRTLAALLAQRRDPTEDLPRFLKIFEQVCQTLAYAHARGVLHRDLKPANIMVGSFGEVQVMDWGLAKVLLREGEAPAEPAASGSAGASPSRPDDPLTYAGAIMGTPAYMPPEQARGAALDERCDVFGLGAMLCEILTGQPPYANANGRNVLEQAQHGNLTEAFARLDARGADADLARLTRDCLAPQPGDRPRDARMVAERMTAHLAAVQERLRAAELERTAAHARAEEARAKAAAERRARRLTMSLAAFVLLAALGGGGGWLWIQNDRATRAAEQARKEFETVQSISVALEQARGLQDRGQYTAALAAARKAEGLLAGGGETLRPRVEEILTDLEMVARLDQIRLETAEQLPDQSGFDPGRLIPRYQQAFDRYGISILKLENGDASERIRRRAIHAQLLAALDHWAAFDPDEATRHRLLLIAQAADDDPKGVMAALRQAWIDNDSEAFQRVVFTDERVKHLPPHVLVNLGASLGTHGDAAQSVRLLRSGLALHPEDFWLNYQLGFSLTRLKPPQTAEATRYYSAAIAVRSDVPILWVNLGATLASQGRLPEAMDAFRKALDLQSDFAPAHYNLGVAWALQKESAKARAAFEEAIRLQPGFAPAHRALGSLLAQQNSPDEAEKHLREAIRLKPSFADAHKDLGTLLATREHWDDAIEEYRTALEHAPNDANIWKNLGEIQLRRGHSKEAEEALEKALHLNPNFVQVLNDLGFVRLQQNRLEDAARLLRKAVALQPSSVQAYGNLAEVLRRQGNGEECIAAYRKVVELQPAVAEARYNLGNALLERGDVAEAIAACKKAIDLKGDYAEPHVNLGLALLRQGRFDQAKANLDKGQKLFGARDPRRSMVQSWLGDCEKMKQLAEKLPAILKGDVQPADNRERILLAAYCQQSKHYYAAAARLFAEAFAADAKLVDDPQTGLRYNAACAAVLAAAGQGEDAPAPDDKARVRWRKQALDWLRADLVLWSKQVDKGAIPARMRARTVLRRWQTDRDLTAVREAVGQVWLPEGERRAWRKLWADVAELGKKAGS